MIELSRRGDESAAVEIALFPEGEVALPAGAPPAVAAEEGEPAREGLRIFLQRDVAAWIEQFSASDLSAELGGILVGRALQDEAGEFVLVEGAIEARHAQRSRASITFTHAAWEHINARLEADWPECRIVGWFHTHPGFGIFLSGYDLFIHRHFFDLPWQVAYVVDPRARSHGFFQWRAGRIDPAPGHYVYTSADPALAAPPEPTAEDDPFTVLTGGVSPFADMPAFTPGRSPHWGVALGLLLTAGAMAALVADDLRLRSELARLRVRAADTPRTSGPPRNHSISVRERQAPTPAAIPAEGTRYRIQRGDSPSRISLRFYGTPDEYERILRANGGLNPRALRVGATIVIPPLDERAAAGR